MTEALAPTTSEIEAKEEFILELSEKKFLNNVREVSLTTTHDQDLQNVYLLPEASRLMILSLDRQIRLSVSKMEILSQTGNPVPIKVDGTQLVTFLRSLPRDDGKIYLYVDNKGLKVKTPVTISPPLPTKREDFPGRWQDLVPQDQYGFVANREFFLDQLMDLAKTSGNQAGLLVIEPCGEDQKQGISITARHLRKSIFVPVEGQIPQFRLGFHFDQLKQLFEHLVCDAVKIKMPSNENHPAVFTKAETKNFFHFLMPAHIRSGT